MSGIGYQGISRFLTRLDITKHVDRTTYFKIFNKCEHGVLVNAFPTNALMQQWCRCCAFIVDRDKFSQRLNGVIGKISLKVLKSYAESQSRANVLFASGSNAWSHLRQASESILEFITPMNFQTKSWNLFQLTACALKKSRISSMKIALEIRLPMLALSSQAQVVKSKTLIFAELLNRHTPIWKK